MLGQDKVTLFMVITSILCTVILKKFLKSLTKFCYNILYLFVMITILIMTQN